MPGQAGRHLSRMQVLGQTLARLEAQHQIQRRMQRQRDRWLAFLSHDLRAPQSNILSLLELRQEGVDGMDDERFYGSLRLQVERTLRLAEGFVDLLRAESDRLNLQHCSPSELAVEAVDRCWPQARMRQVRIEQRSAGEDEGLLLADPELITRALVNLLNNAVRHCAAGGQVTLCVAHDTGCGQWLCTVRDEGEGLDEARLAQLLQSLDSHTWLRSREAPVPGRAHGLGLGLLVARTVVSRHGGELSAWSAPGQGCTFVIALPAAPRLPPGGGAGALSSGIPAAATRALPA
jgi:signal transduction histidine kinase